MSINYSSRSPTSGLRRLVVPVGLAVAAGFFLLGSTFVFRTQLAVFLIEGALRDAGLSEVSLTVSHVGMNELIVQDIEAEKGALRIKRVEAGFDVIDLWDRRLEFLTIDGLGATLRWDATGMSLGGFRLRTDSGPLEIPHIGRLRANDMAVVINTPGATYNAPLSLSAEPAGNGWNSVVSAALYGPGVSVELNWTGVIAPTDLAQSSGRGRFELLVDDFVVPGTSNRVDAQGVVTLEAGGGVLSVGVDRPVTLSKSLSPVPSPSSLLQDLAGLPWSVTIAPLQSKSALVLTAAGELRTLSVDLTATGEAGDGRLNLTIVGECAQTAQTTEFRLAKAHADVTGLRLAGGVVAGHLTASNFAGDSNSAAGRIDAAFEVAGGTLGAVSLAEARASLSSRVSIADGNARFDFESFQINLIRGAHDTWDLAAPAELSLAKAAKNAQSITISPITLDTSVDLAFALPELKLRARDEEGAEVVLNAPDLRLTATSTGRKLSAALAGTDVAFSHPAAEARSGRFDLDVDDGAASGTASARVVRLGANSPGAVPVGALVTSATLGTKGDDLDVRGTLSTASGAKLGEYTARFSPDLARGTAALSIPRARFERGGKFDPADLPFIASVSEITGTITLNAKTAWNAARMTGSARAALEDVSFAMGEVKVAGLTTTLELSGLTPAQSAGVHRLTAQSVTAGLPLTALKAQYSFPGDGTAVIEGASVDVAGGQITLTDAAIPIDGRAGGFSLGVRQIDMGLLAAQAKIDGLTVTGTLTGTIPLRSDEAGYHFAEGMLRADAPGRLVYAPSSPSPALSQNQGGSLALQALSNFAYDRLSMTLTGPVTEDLSLLVAIAGKNPDLYGGYPIEFNLNLSGRLAQILRQGLVGAGGPAELERQLRQAKPSAP